MGVLLFFNEISCNTPSERSDVDEAMAQFARLLNRISQWRKDAALVSDLKLKDLELAPGYYLAQWAGQSRHVDLWRSIRSMQNRAPFNEVLPEGVGEGAEYSWAGQPARALGAAHLLDGILVSLLLDRAWDAPWVEASRTLLAEGSHGEVITVDDAVQVRHAATLAHSAVHEEWIKHAGLLDLRHGSEIWVARAEIFPHLLFLPQVREQLNNLVKEWVIPLARELGRINDAIGEWDPQRTPLPQWRSYITPEHEQRKRLCRFVDFDGIERIFDLLGRFSPVPGRVYFRLVPEQRKATIAHVGRKLGV
jgi:hypothetical protein